MPADSIGATFGLEMVRALSYAPTIPLIWAMFADVADYAEWKTGRRTTGVVFATILFGLKTGLSLGGAIAGWLLSGFGYRAERRRRPSTRCWASGSRRACSRRSSSRRRRCVCSATGSRARSRSQMGDRAGRASPSVRQLWSAPATLRRMEGPCRRRQIALSRERSRACVLASRRRVHASRDRRRSVQRAGDAQGRFRGLRFAIGAALNANQFYGRDAKGGGAGQVAVQHDHARRTS